MSPARTREAEHEVMRKWRYRAMTAGFRPRLLLSLSLVALAAWAERAPALVEEVLVTHAGTDDAVIQRPSGECWWLDLRQDCFGIRDFKGRTVLLWSPTADVTTAARLLVPERDASCPIWQADTLRRDARAAYAGDVPGAGLRAVRQALGLLGYENGLSHPGWTPEAARALHRFCAAKGLDASPRGMRRVVAALALEVVRGHRVTPDATRLARLLSEQAAELAPYLARIGDGSPPRPAPTHIGFVAPGGALVRLGDGTRWEPRAEARPLVALWRVGDEVIAGDGRIANGRTGDLVRAVRLEER